VERGRKPRVKTFILFLLALAALPCAGLHPLDPAGEWMGIPQSDSASTILLKIIKADRGGWKAICESVNHSAGSDRMIRSLYWGGAPIAVTSITLKNGVFKFSIDALQIEYEGKLSADGNSIAGLWSVDNQLKGPLDFTRMSGSLPVTGVQLEKMLAADKGQSDHEVAQQLYGLEPIERLAREQWRAGRPRCPAPARSRR
jgi:hypothetical protein